MHPSTVSQQGVELVKKFEGLHKVQPDGTVSSYRCPAGVWTIGYGATKGVRSGTKLTVQECEDRLLEELNEFGAQVRRVVDVPLTQSQFDAIVSLTFNIGIGNLKSSTLLRKLNAGDYAAVPAQMMRWNKARVDGKLTPLKGLTRRRAAEAAVFTMDAQLPSDDGGDTMVQKVTVQDKKPLTKSKTMAGAGVAGAATVLSEITPQVEALIPYAESMKTLFLLLALAGVGLAIYARMKDQKDGVDV